MRQNLDAAVRSFATAEHRTETLITGTLLTLASAVAPVVGLALFGYVVRVVRAGGDGSASLPAFDEWRALALDGGRAALATAPLHLPGLVVLAAVLGAHEWRLASPYALVALRDGVVPPLGLVAGILAVVGLELVAGYLSVAVLVAVARRGSLGFGVFERAADLARDRAFVRGFALAFVVGVVGHVLGGFARLVPVLGGPTSACVSFVALVVGASVLGRASPSVGPSPRLPDDRADDRRFDAVAPGGSVDVASE
jgi:hypothetical protein